MLLRLGPRILLWIAACGLAACSSTSDSASADSVEGVAMLVSGDGPTLSLHTPGVDAPPAPNGNPIVRKTVEPIGLGALIATFADQGLFQHTLPMVPPDARQVLVLDREGGRTVWAFASDTRDPRMVAFLQARSMFLQLFNHSQNYVPPPQSGTVQDAADPSARGSR